MQNNHRARRRTVALGMGAAVALLSTGAALIGMNSAHASTTRYADAVCPQGWYKSYGSANATRHPIACNGSNNRYFVNLIDGGAKAADGTQVVAADGTVLRPDRIG